ncbi:putative Single domain von Willebrand factor type C-containing protein 1 [Homarus americanus]|uniref:Putative Single domain von Willebrand factor type C-containing protein 1 n=1 Tax=Homarus americanus TaxID=6706 RepID=A0A8J5JZD3_HOMAM|nr:putative Single domain von Willebrand factor type C-containing protein 1 [Homarus americanus]
MTSAQPARVDPTPHRPQHNQLVLTPHDTDLSTTCPYFPGLCFGSTTCRVYNVTESWAILPFCGKATCVKEGDALFEVVSECARAKPRADCNEILVNPAEVPFPDCCPTYNCTGGPIEYYTQAESEQLLAASASLPNAGPATGVTTS